jgi:nucleotide-binding universal stress UspA family protein
MKNILCPTDFSETANNAIAYAAKLAQKFQGTLTLLHVQSMFDLTPVELIRGTEITIEGVKQQLEAQCDEVTRAFKVSCFAEVESSFRKLSAVIRDKAANFDLIVMGSDGPDDLYQFLSGSNTYNAIVKSEVPVLIVPVGYVYSEIRSIVYAFDYLKDRNLPLAHLVPLLKSLQCRLTVLQIMEEAYSKDAEDELKEIQFILKNFYRDDIVLEYDTIHSSEIAQSINSYIQRIAPDALALCSIHHNLLGKLFHKSVIRHISTISNYPVIVFHQ